MTRFGPIAALLLVVLLTPPPLEAADGIAFNRDIRPILADACFTCHGFDAASREADLRLDTFEAATADFGGYQPIAPGDVDESEAFQRIIAEHPADQMPPPDHTRQLTDEEIQLIARWIDEGAAYEDHWAFIAPTRPELPRVDDDGWIRNAIDHFILARLERDGIRPSQPAARHTLIRRVTLDLTGLPPTPEEVDAFVNDDRPDAYERLVDRLLASPRYGEHMAWTWLDAARYSDTSGYQADRTREQWPWRDWVVRAFNANMPYDQFTVEQVAGDLLPDRTRQQHLASAFNRNHMANNEGGAIAEESRVNYVIDRVDTTSTIWLGLTMSCAQCHDHKYDPISQKDFYRFYAYFNNVAETGAPYDTAPLMSMPTDAQQQQLDAFAADIADLESRLQADPQPNPDELAQWSQQLLSSVEGPTWHQLPPTAIDSEAGATLAIASDNIIHVSGENPINDTYTITLELPAGKLTALRLETFTDATFTHGGLARSDSGNFVLTGIEAEVHGEQLRFASADADFNQNGFPPTNAIDGNPSTGYAILDNVEAHRDRVAIFTFAEPLHLEAPGEITVRLRHDSPHAHHNIGRFRLLATSADAPALDQGTAPPAPLIDALRTDPEERDAAQQDLITEAFADHRRRTLQQQIDDVRAQRQAVESSAPQVMVMGERDDPRDTFVLEAGGWDQYGQKVSTGTPGALHAMPGESGGNRLDLAQWLISEDNPLTARVTVNRFWQHYFGIGIVKTAEDFGVRAELPSHPQLLDWLAVEFVQSGWDVKRMHRLIVTSNAYQQSSRMTDSDLRERDPENRLIARGPRRRLPSHVLRDQALALAGLLVEKTGGPGVTPYQPPGIWEEVTFGQISYTQSTGEDLYRRSLYTFWRRIVGPTTFFDVSDRTVCAVTPRLTNTPLHALILLNDPAYVEAARHLAQRMLLEGGDNATDRLTWAFNLATTRDPQPDELAILKGGLQRARSEFANDPQAANELLSVGDSARDETLDPVDHAAYTAIASLILNLDEVLIRE